MGSSNRPSHREESDGLRQDNKPSHISSSNVIGSSSSEMNIAHSSVVLWKRFEPGDDDVARRAGGASSPSERFRIVNAMLIDDSNEPDNQDEDDHGRRRKRRKLTLLDTSTTTSAEVAGGSGSSYPLSPLHSIMASSAGPGAKSPRTPLKILDPLTRIVDDSLQEVLAGTRSVAEHYELLTTDPRFTLQAVHLQKKWLTWSHSSGGNLLHCCALWNDSAVAHQILQQHHRHRHPLESFARAGSAGTDVGNNGGNILSMMEAVDGDGRTPYEVAQLVGHQDVCQVLEAYGGDTTNYVYDIFYVDDAKSSHTSTSSDNDIVTGFRSMANGDEDDDPHSKIMTAELTSGVGYWTPEGELILEADERCSRSLSYETDGDIDSNCEEYGGNDYPDEEEEDDADDENQVGGFDGVQIGSRAVLHDDGEIYDDYDDDDDGCRLDQAYDNYDEYDWEQDLGDGKEHSYYDESHYSEE